VGSALRGILYVLDEPSIGLHQRDNKKLIETLEELRDAGNTVLVVEHDEETIEASDWVVDVGPGAGELGGASSPRGPPRRFAGRRTRSPGSFSRARRRSRSRMSGARRTSDGSSFAALAPTI